MSLTWRYHLRPDGSFSRSANIDGALDSVTDEQFARMDLGREGEEQPKRPCSRCLGDLLLHWHGPLITGEWMELCPACDADRPAARAFIRWYLAPQRTAEKLPQLFEDWETETMQAKGWVRIP
ncbi:DUF6300 family protein [Streptomyces sp. NPDC055287]